MATVGEILVRLGVDTTGLAAGEAEATAAFGGIESSARAMAAGLVASLGIFAGGSFLADAVSEAEKAQTSLALLTQSLQDNAVGWNGDMTAVDAAIQHNLQFGVTASQTRDSLTRLVAGTHDLSEALNIQSVALDLAAFKHVDLATATDALTHVEAGRYRGLADLGIETAKGITQEEALAAVHRVTAGAAQALADTDTGQLAAAQASINDSMERLGTTLLPSVASGMKTLADGSQTLADNLNTIEPIAEAVALTIGVKLAAGAVAAGIDILGLGADAVTATPEVAGLGAAAGAAAGAGGIAGLGLSVGQLAAPFAAMVAFKDQITGFFGGLMNGVNNFITGSNPFQDRVNAITQEWSHQTPVVQANTAALVSLTGASRDTDGQLNDLGATVTTFDGVLNGSTQQIGTATDAIAEFGRQAIGVTGYVGDTDTAVKDLETTLKDVYGITINDGDAALYLARGLNAAGVAAQLAGAQLAAFNRANPINTGLGAGTADAQRQFSSVYGAADALGKSNLDAAEKAFQESLKTTIAHVGGSTAAASAAFATMAADAKANLGSAFGTIKEYADNYFDALHQRNLDAIQDSHDLKAAAIQDARDKVNAELDAEETGLRGKLTAAQQAFQARKDAEQETRLENAVTQAQANLAGAAPGTAQFTTAQDQLQQAKQNLADFQDQLALNSLQTQTNAQIAADEAKRKADDAYLTTIAKANDKQAADAKAAENDRYNDQKTAFDKELAQLQSALARHPEEWAKAQERIVTLLGQYGVTIANAGTKVGQDYAKALAAALAAGEADVVAALEKLAGVAADRLALHGSHVGKTTIGAELKPAPINIVIHSPVILDGRVIQEHWSKQAAIDASQQTSGYTTVVQVSG